MHRFLTIHSEAIAALLQNRQRLLTTTTTAVSVRPEEGSENVPEEGSEDGSENVPEEVEEVERKAVGDLLFAAVVTLRVVQKATSGSVKELLQHSLCLLQFFAYVRSVIDAINRIKYILRIVFNGFRK